MAMFGQAPQGTPLQQVLQMRQQGFPDNQIVQGLQKQGYATQQIFDAVSQADLSAIPAGPGPMQMEGTEAAPPGYGAGAYPEQYAQPGAAPQPPQGAQQAEYAPQSVSNATETRINEIAEAIINEKWEEVFGEIQKVIVWKEKMEAELQKIKDDINTLKEQFDGLHQGVLGKVGEYDERMRDVSSEVKAVHKVFQDVIPTFTENVAELGRVAKTLRKGKEK